jgi:RNA polymerase sigma-70 factor (ECF subfamily)
MAAAMQAAIARLREDDRDCLTMRYLNGLPVAEVAEHLGRTETAAQKLCLRALDRLREAYRAVVGEHSSR